MSINLLSIGSDKVPQLSILSCYTWKRIIYTVSYQQVFWPEWSQGGPEKGGKGGRGAFLRFMHRGYLNKG